MRQYNSSYNLYAYMLAFAFFLALPLVGFAQINAQGNLDVEGGSGSMDAEAGVEAQSTSSSVVNVETEAGSRAEVDVNTPSGVNMELSDSGVAVSTSGQVNSESDLQVFINNFPLENEGVARVEARHDDESSEGEVSVHYNHRAKFLGFIPVTLRSETTITTDADGESQVRVRTPFWAFLTTGSTVNKSDLQSRVENSTRVRASASAAASANASAQAKAELIERIAAEIEAYANAEAEASISNGS